MGLVQFSRPSTWLYHEGSCHEVGHTWHPSCLYSFAELFCIVFYEGFKIYLPLYLVTQTDLHFASISTGFLQVVDVLRRRSPREMLLKGIPQVLRSSLFLAINGSGFVAFICLIRWGPHCCYTPLHNHVPRVLLASCIPLSLQETVW